MPSPIAHSVSGYAISQFIPLGEKIPKWLKSSNISVLYILFVSNFADLDFIPQILTGKKYHHGFTHSIVFALLVSIVLFLICKYFYNFITKRFFLLTLALYCSHLFLDSLTFGSRGIQIFWPFTNNFFNFPLSIFPGVHYSKGFFHTSHLLFIGFELGYSALIFWGCWRWKNKNSAHG